LIVSVEALGASLILFALVVKLWVTAGSFVSFPGKETDAASKSELHWDRHCNSKR